MHLPAALDDLIAYLEPDALWVAGERHSEDAYTVWVLTLDYSYNEYLASLSLDGRWTVSPRSGPCYDDVTTPIRGRTDPLWREMRRSRRETSTTT
jgi:hypothetical protein